ncbi:MAG TPA: extracellular solute-binding protein [Tepidisphaeraceae bacterium]|nr:extracellular solute-binding protein [Tepidisphaeraceae bacterium]
MRRYTFVILFFVVLVTPFILRRAIGTPAAYRAPAPTGDPLKLVIVTPHVESIRREFEQAFSAWHQQKYGRPVEIDWRNYGGASAIVKFFEASRATYDALGGYGVDLVWGGGDALFEDQLKKAGHLQPVTLAPEVMQRAFAVPDLGGLPLYDRGTPPQWFGTALSSFGIAYNRDVIAHLGLPEPKTWCDLSDPRYRGWIVMADPTLSSSAKAAYMTVVERAMADAAQQGRSEDDGWADGMGLLRQIAANARLFTDASSALPGQISSGDVAAGMTIDFHSLNQIDVLPTRADGTKRMAYVEPVNATAVNPDPIAVARTKGKVSPVALRFIEFVLSEPGQKLWYTPPGQPGGPRESGLYRLPIQASLYETDPTLRGKANPFKAAEGFNTSPERKRTFRILGELIQLSMMDLLDDLRETRRMILESPRAGELDARLGKFPFDQQEALRREKQWQAAAPIERLALQRKWTNEFREEYRSLREEARGD